MEHLVRTSENHSTILFAVFKARSSSEFQNKIGMPKQELKEFLTVEI